MSKIRTLTTHDVRHLRVLGGKKGTRRIGKVKCCVFHPAEKKCVGYLIKRPDLLWMFRRKDAFVALDEYDIEDGRIVVNPDASLKGEVSAKKHGLNWDDCVLWEGMPLMTADETLIGYVGTITFNRRSVAIQNVIADNGATSKLLLGTLEVPADYIVGFRRGIGVEMSQGQPETDEDIFRGAILVSDDVWELSPEGGWAEAAGEFTAKAGAKIHEASERAKPKVQAATKAAGEAINEGAYAVGKQVAASKGMFSNFKEEYNKARAGEESAMDREDTSKGMFAAFKEEFDKAKNGEED